MRVNAASTAVRYEAPGHIDVESVRLQGQDAGGAQFCTVSVSTYPPGAGVESQPTAVDTVYVVLDGHLEITSHDDESTHRLGQFDSVSLRAGETRSLWNRTDADARLLVVLAPPN